MHTFPELLRTTIMLQALGWHDQDDAEFLRHDAALRVAVSDDRGVTPLAGGDKSPGGLASQPTLSRLHEALATEHNRTVLRSFLLEGAARRLKAANDGHRQRYVTLDIDSLPVEVCRAVSDAGWRSISRAAASPPTAGRSCYVRSTASSGSRRGSPDGCPPPPRRSGAVEHSILRMLGHPAR